MAVILIPSGSRVKRTHLTLADAVTFSFQNKSPFGIVCLVFWLGDYPLSTQRSVFSVSEVPDWGSMHPIHPVEQNLFKKKIEFVKQN